MNIQAQVKSSASAQPVTVTLEGPAAQLQLPAGAASQVRLMLPVDAVARYDRGDDLARWRRRLRVTRRCAAPSPT
jgi:hypothetical protein